MKESYKFKRNFFIEFASLIANHENCKSDKFFNQVFNIISTIVEYDFLSIYLYNEEDNKIELVSKRGSEIDLIKLIKFELGNGLSAWVAKDKNVVNLKNINNKTADGTVMHSFCSFPLLHENQLIGVMNMGSKIENAFSDEIVFTLEGFSPLLASIILKNDLISQIKEQKQAIERMNSELKTTKDQLIKMEQKEAVSAAIVSLNHEINNPLMIIQGNLQLLKISTENDESVKKINVIESQLDRVNNLMKKLRDLKEVKLKEYVNGSNHKMLDF